MALVHKLVWFKRTAIAIGYSNHTATIQKKITPKNVHGSQECMGSQACATSADNGFQPASHAGKRPVVAVLFGASSYGDVARCRVSHVPISINVIVSDAQY